MPTHYIFQTKMSDQNPEKSPVVIWMSGGDGCSSLQSLIQQIGPYRMRYPRQTLLSTLNQNTWLKKANLLFIDAPVNTGFSYTKTDKEYELNDETTSKDLYNAILYFYNNKFQDFKNSDIIIACEGDSAQYITLLAELIFQGNENKKVGDDGFVNLKSIIYQSPFFQSDDSSKFWGHERSLELLDYHGLYGPQMESLWYECVDPSNRTPYCAYFKEQFLNSKVQINPFNINDKCQKKTSSSTDEFTDDISESSYCYSWKYLENYMNKNKQSFNLGDTFPEGHTWQMCSYIDEINYVHTEGGVISNIAKLLQEKDIFIVIVSGLEDAVSTYLQNEQDVQKLINKAKLTDDGDIKAFLSNYQVAGVVSSYGNKLQWVRVKDGGYFTFGDNPSAGLSLLEQTIIREPFSG
ncbi:hypothetical protein PPERSA_09664 [Pseudocohnilembus persalinus]|uniref:Uncharacterized protein n=1 Tax=Pseudocohnilembus persalinus TaxID=266149 RepID=A0A0V0R7X4_PSEPJ|nr:hypothetical protein PPERSA_09664 [Pseudocohnilembus persalinus]|eukprot:KRX10280.1 hypothetical protein PPERSA_09664 [Pseudocohnilembus persalinus]